MRRAPPYYVRPEVSGAPKVGEFAPPHGGVHIAVDNGSVSMEIATYDINNGKELIK